jgi:hypothetical protein
MIIADENIDRNIILALRKTNHKITSIAENYPGISDEDVIHLAITLEGILLACDKDIGEWVFAHAAKDSVFVFTLRKRRNRRNNKKYYFNLGEINCR